jgi:alpha-L-rhamnosidase
MPALAGVLTAGALTHQSARAQAMPELLDPSRNAGAVHDVNRRPLAEEFIWTGGDVTIERPDRGRYSWARTDLRIEPHVFRTHFELTSVPKRATLYIAGPRSASVFLNGKLIGSDSTNPEGPINFRVFHFDAAGPLQRGDNVLVVQAVRGRGVVTGLGRDVVHQIAYGEVLAVKLLAGSFGEEQAPVLAVSNSTWLSAASPTGDAWQSATFDDSRWQHVESLGAIDSNIEFRQWSADAGMYGWPGYSGISSFLRVVPIRVAGISHTYEGRGKFEHLNALASGGAGPFTVRLLDPTPTDEQAPSLLVDFGRELAGQIVIDSASAQDAVLSIAYGESELEAMATGLTPGQRGGNYLGTNLLDLPANGEARGPKSAFRYARVTFLRGGPAITLRSVGADAITNPVTYQGSFESSDAKLNRIWETAAYTAHLCMQDDVWDAPKRDRGRWAGDLDVEAGTILSVFGDTLALEDTLTHLADDAPAGVPVNGIDGYTAQWIMALSKLYGASGDAAFVQSQHASMLRLLGTMDASLDPRTGLLRRDTKGWGFIDWAPGLYGQTDDTWRGATLEYLRAYRAAPLLLRAAGDDEAARKYQQRADALTQAAQAQFEGAGGQALGSTWQVNAMAVLARVNPAGDESIWDHVLSHVKQDAPEDQVVSPYFNSYVLDAMAATGQPREAMDWMRAYWGGMLDEGATSFWESYDLRWPKTNFHLALSADGTSGYYVSLAHGWASWPAPWLLENVLGIRATEPGFKSADIRPELLGLAYARGSMATPHGPLRVSIGAKQWTVDLPAGVERARVFLPWSPEPTILTHPGHYAFSVQP